MKKKKGFTLIELLAVIVILAIIALIAVPVIMNIITQAKKSAFKDTAYGIIKAGELYYADKLLGVTRMEEDVTIILPDTTNTLNLNGDIPNGVVKITKDGNVSIAISNGKYCVTKGLNDSDVILIEDYDTCEMPSMKLADVATTSTKLNIPEVNSCAKSGICDPGTAFAIRVNSTDTYKFYVISDDGTTVNLIMDRNIGDKVEWASSAVFSENRGVDIKPITALEELETSISNWSNIPKYTYILESDYDGKGGQTTYSPIRRENVRARLLTYTEATNLGCTDSGNTSNCPSYLYENLSVENSDAQPLGYWTSTTFSNTNTPAWTIYYQKYLSLQYAASAYANGVRPVITLNKSTVLAEDIDLEIEDLVLIKDATYQLLSTTKPVNASINKLKYISSDESVVTIDENGLITAIEYGSATITVSTTDGTNIQKTINVTVGQAVEDIELNTTSVSLLKGTSYQMETNVVPEDAINKTLSWKSNWTAKATVDENGLITGIESGTTTITVSTIDGTNISKTINVTVRELVESITLSQETVSVGIGADYDATIMATVLPSTATNKTLNWVSSDTSIATVDSNGKITGVALGTTDVTVSTTDGTNISKTIQVTVNTPYERGIMQSADNCINEGVCASGTSVKVAVNDTETYRFYVINDTGSELTLIMNQNIAYSEWISSIVYKTENTDGTICNYSSCTDEGPITAINTLNSKTSSWTNIDEREYTYTDDGYSTITKTMKARLLTYSETLALGCTFGKTTCPSWLYVNLYNTGGTAYSYWLSTSSPTYHGKLMYYDGSINRISNVYSISGIRPVITLSKEEVLAESLTLSDTSISVGEGFEYKVTASISPSNTLNKKLKWTSADESVATVDENGLITGVNAGTTTITATTTDGTNISQTVEVTVLKIYTNEIMTSFNSCILAGTTCSVDDIKSDEGILVNVQVNTKESYNFYVMNDTGTFLTLIMEQNVGNVIPWYSDGDDSTNNETNSQGPITALEYLNTQTADWTNINPVSNYIYNNNLNGTTRTYGYQKLEIVNGIGKLTSQDGAKITTIEGTSRTRLLTYEEASDIGCITNSESCPNWLYGKLNGSGVFGYWMLSAWRNSVYAYNIYTKGYINSSIVRFNGTSGYYVRPVITIQKATPVESLDLGTTTLSMVNGATYQIEPTITPAAAYNKTLSYSSSNTSVATVDEKGIIKGIASGTATITATTTDGSNIRQTIQVTVLKSYTNEIMTSFNSCILAGTTCSVDDIKSDEGVKVTVQVNDSQSYEFYVIADTGSELTLIMNRNLGDNVAWISSDDYATANTDETSCGYTSCNDEGPVTAINALKTATTYWTNVTEREYTYSGLAQDGTTRKYEDITETMKARMLTYAEASALGCTTSNKSCPSWLYRNLYTTGDSTTDSNGNYKLGYWTSTAYPSNSVYAWFVRNFGSVSVSGVNDYTNVGLRPVITLSK